MTPPDVDTSPVSLWRVGIEKEISNSLGLTRVNEVLYKGKGLGAMYDLNGDGCIDAFFSMDVTPSGKRIIYVRDGFKNLDATRIFIGNRDFETVEIPDETINKFQDLFMGSLLYVLNNYDSLVRQNFCSPRSFSCTFL